MEKVKLFFLDTTVQGCIGVICLAFMYKIGVFNTIYQIGRSLGKQIGNALF